MSILELKVDTLLRLCATEDPQEQKMIRRELLELMKEIREDADVRKILSFSRQNCAECIISSTPSLFISCIFASSSVIFVIFSLFSLSKSPNFAIL